MTTAIHNSSTGSDVWHAIDADEVLRRLESNPETGLDAAEVSWRLLRYGPNQLPVVRGRGPFPPEIEVGTG
jgi:Ca2+-transporting ATPase